MVRDGHIFLRTKFLITNEIFGENGFRSEKRTIDEQNLSFWEKKKYRFLKTNENITNLKL